MSDIPEFGTIVDAAPSIPEFGTIVAPQISNGPRDMSWVKQTGETVDVSPLDKGMAIAAGAAEGIVPALTTLSGAVKGAGNWVLDRLQHSDVPPEKSVIDHPVLDLNQGPTLSQGRGPMLSLSDQVRNAISRENSAFSQVRNSAPLAAGVAEGVGNLVRTAAAPVGVLSGAVQGGLEAAPTGDLVDVLAGAGIGGLTGGVAGLAGKAISKTPEVIFDNASKLSYAPAVTAAVTGNGFGALAAVGAASKIESGLEKGALVMQTILDKTPQSLKAVMQGAAQAGPRELAIKHFILSQQNPEYQKSQLEPSK